MKECYKVVRVREGSFQSLIPINIFLRKPQEPRRIGGNLIYRLDQKTEGFKDSLGIFVYLTKGGRTAEILRPAFHRRGANIYCGERPVALLRCECGDLERQRWRLLAPGSLDSNPRYLQDLSSWIELQAKAKQILSGDLRASSDLLHSELLDLVASEAYTTPWVIPREVVGRIGV